MQKFRRLLYPVLTVCFLLMMVGYYLGRQSVDGILLTTQHPTPQASENRSLPVFTDPDSPKRIDLNRATLEELMTLPGIGEARARSILEYREANGPFHDTSELMNVSGIGEKIYAKLCDYVYVEENHEDSDH